MNIKIKIYQKPKILLDLILNDARHKVTAILLISPMNRLWFTKFESSEGIILVTKNKNYLFLDGRYYYQALKFSDLSNIHEIVLVTDYWKTIKRVLKQNFIDMIGFESDYVSYKKAIFLNSIDKGIIFIPFESAKLRVYKSAYEIECIKKAVLITDKTFEYIFSILKPGMKENYVANLITQKMMSLGAADVSFPPIVASGVNTAYPHHHPTSKIIKKNELVILDIGCKYKGYCSDMTRTVAIYGCSKELAKIYEIVKEAQELGIKNCKPDFYLSSIDSIVRNFISLKGYGDKFIHGLGHSLGIEVHESPYLNRQDYISKVSNNLVFTVEPGIYIDNLGGVRIEDDILIENSKQVVLGSTTKELLILKN